MAAMEPGELLTRWPVRVALLFYAIALGLRLTASGRRGRLAVARLYWTAGFAAFVLHVAYAFHFFHGWSHRDAHAATARQTAEVVGWDWGGGVWANYLFAAVWLADAAWWWGGRERYEARPQWVEWAVQGFLGFIAFNAAVVFADGPVRWIVASMGMALILLYCSRRGIPVA